MSQLPQLPRIITAEAVLPTMQGVLAEQAAVREAVAQSVNPNTACFENAIKPIIDVENRTQGRIAVIAMLRYASPDDAARAASDAAIGLMREAESQFTSQARLFAIFQAVAHRGEQLDPESAKYLAELVKDFMRCGHGGRLQGDQIRSYLDNRNKIDALRRAYNANIRNDTGGMWFSLEELEGVPEEDLARFLQGGQPNNQDTNRRFVRFTRADTRAVLEYANSAVTRKKMYIAHEARPAENIALFKEIIVRRDQNARLLGYASHAAFRLESRVAKKPEWVEDLLDELEQVLLPLGRKEMQSLLSLRRNKGQKHTVGEEANGMMPPWDFDYYARLALEELQIDHARIAEYFPLDHVVPAMLAIFKDTLQLRFELITDLDSIEHSTWHPIVTAYRVWDDRKESSFSQSDNFVGFLYLDLFARPHKHQGSQNVNLQCSYVAADGTTRIPPATVLMCSFPQRSSSSAHLLRHGELVSLFHELGHAVHDLVARTKYARFHGHRAPPDFFEVPSVMLENWCWLRDELRAMSCHHAAPPDARGRREEGVVIPDALLDGLVRSRHVNRALWFLRQLALARFDLAVHHHHHHHPEDAACAVGDLDLAAIFHELRARLQMLAVPPPTADDPGSAQAGGHPEAHFQHLVSGMDAGYYAYLSAHVLAADIFENTFAADPRSRDAWERYRRGILEFGGSRDELLMLEEFLGHKPSAEYLIKQVRN